MVNATINKDFRDTTLKDNLRHTSPFADIRIEKEENCFPMIPSGAAHNEMILSADDNNTNISEVGLALV